MIVYDFKMGINQEECVENIRLAYGSQVLSRATVFSCSTENREGRNSFLDGEYTRRPLSAIVPENVLMI